MRHLLVLFGALVLASCTPQPRSTSLLDKDPFPVGDFSLTERSGRTVGRGDLLGKVWVASFIFTRCAGPCSQVTGTMARLQSELANEQDVILVSFTVDPQYDTPKVLTAYADRFGAHAERWLFLTGKEDEVYPLIRESFKLAAEQNAGAARTPGNEVTHSTRLAVVDRRGQVRDYFDATQAEDVPKLRQRVADLLREKP
jgi:protein SCO1